MSRFVRASKYRHVFGKDAKNEDCYDNVNLTKTAWDSNFMDANGKFWSLIWGVAGGGAVGVFPHSQVGKLPMSGVPLIVGHKAHVLDVQFNPFNQNLLATVSEDCFGKIWQIPDGGLAESATDAAQTLKGHRRKVGTVNWHPTAENVIATSSQDMFVKVWDAEKGSEQCSLDGTKDLIQSFAWNRNGSQFAITCKDKQIRVADPRSGSYAQTWAGHIGVKGSRCVFMKDGMLFTVGFGKGSERQYMLHDLKNVSKPVVTKNIDNSSGVIMPFYDEDTSMLYLAGKGDGNVRYFEYTGDEEYLYYLSEYKSAKPLAGGCMLPKTALDIPGCEVARFLKLENTRIVPVSFTVPRRSELFADDIYPETSSGSYEPGGSSKDYFGGKDPEPVKVSLEKGFVPKEKPQPKFEKQTEDEDAPKTLAEALALLKEKEDKIAKLETDIRKLQT